MAIYTTYDQAFVKFCESSSQVHVMDWSYSFYHPIFLIQTFNNYQTNYIELYFFHYILGTNYS